MLSSLKNHPFAVEAFFESSLVLTYAVPQAQLLHLIPPCLQPDTFDERWAFVAAAMVQTRDLRPKGFPRAIGNDFFLLGYRIFARYTTSEGKRLRGLYILKSETDKRKMQLFGNMFTHYKYSTTDIHTSCCDNRETISSCNSRFSVTVDTSTADALLPPGSPFKDWKEARRFSGPLPFTFSYLPRQNKVLIVEGVRQNWQPQPVTVFDHHFAFLDDMGIKNAQLANAFVIQDIPYYWKKGRLDIWNRQDRHFRV